MANIFKKKETFYKKVGRKYVPVYEYDQELMDSFPKGHHLVSVIPGLQSTKYHIDPALAPMVAAGYYCVEAMTKAMTEKNIPYPSKTPITEEQRDLWRKLNKAFGTDVTMNYKCNHDVAQAGVDALTKETEKLLEHPSVRDAYNQFMMVCKLVYEEQK